MFCPVCQEKKLKSKVFPHGSTTTLKGILPYFDEEGVRHFHDTNTITTPCNCSLGHQWITQTNQPCLNCDFGSIPLSIKIINDKETKNYGTI